MKMDRNYFKYKQTGKKTTRYTKCCKLDKDRNHLNKNNPEDWKLIEEYCERQLTDYPSTETIEPICCKKCGRLLKYVSTLNSKAYYGKEEI